MSRAESSSRGMSFHQLGEVDAPVVVLVGGYGEPAVAWEFSRLPQRIAASGRRVIWYAARGVSPSAVPPLPWQMSDLVDDLVGLLDDLGVGQATVVGYSLGGFTAELFAHTHPDRAAAVILVGAAGQPSALARALSAAEVEFAASGGVPPAFGRITTVMTSLASSELCNPEVLDPWLEMVEQLPSVWSSHDGEWGQAQAAHEWIHGGHQEVTGWPAQVGLGVIAFEHDVLCPVHSARDFVAARSGALIRVIPGVAHGGMLTAPEASGAALVEMLDQLGS